MLAVKSTQCYVFLKVRGANSALVTYQIYVCLTYGIIALEQSIIHGFKNINGENWIIQSFIRLYLLLLMKRNIHYSNGTKKVFQYVVIFFYQQVSQHSKPDSIISSQVLLTKYKRADHSEV